jgi:ribosomal protein S18 acetylase RimI-like enzyme
MDIRFRPAQPSDAEAAVPLMYSSGPATFDYIFITRSRDEVAEYLRTAFRDDRGELGYANHTVAELDGEVVGLGTAYSGGDAGRFLVGGLLGLLSFYGPLRTPVIVSRVLRMERIIQPPKGDLHYVAHLGVAPELRSRGIGQRIVEHLLEGGRELGRETAALDVSVENPRAQALYERLGFTPTKECISTLKNRHSYVPSHIRMERAL